MNNFVDKSVRSSKNDSNLDGTKDKFFGIKVKYPAENTEADEDTQLYDIILVSSGINQIILIHDVRTVTCFGLKESKKGLQKTGRKDKAATGIYRSDS